MPTVGQILVNDILPKPLRDYGRVLDKKGTKALLKQVAEEYPDQYQEVLGRLGRFGAQASQRTGGWGLSPDLLQTPEITRKHRERLQRKLQAIYDDDRLTSAEKDEKVTETTMEAGSRLRAELFDKLKEEGHPSALLVASGAKGNPFALSAGLGFDALYVDANDRPQPYPVLHNYSEGLNPFEYWAGTFGARGGVITPKLGTAASGFLAKQVVTITHRGVVSGTDAPADRPVRANVGLPMATDDTDSIGSYLAAPVGGYRRNTLITDAVLRDLQRRKVKDILVRSPVVGGPGDGSLYAYDVGMSEFGRNYVPGENPSVTAGQSVSEGITQGMLSAKHCLAAGTMVRMADFTTKKIEDIQPGDWVLGADEAGDAQPVQVREVYSNGMRECWRTRFTVGQTKESIYLESTLDHKVLCETRHWAPTTEICKSGVFAVGTKCVRLAANMVQTTHAFTGVDEPMALLLGLLLGDGCYKDSVHGAFFSCHDDTLIEDTRQYMTRLGLKFSALKDHYGYYRVSQLEEAVAARDEATGQFLPGDRNPVILKLKELGMWNKYAHEKVLPPEVYSWSKESLAQLLGGLIASDGSIYVGKSTEQVAVNFGSTSEALATQVRDLLRVRFGIFGNKVHSHSLGRKHALYSFVITRRKEVERFARLIPLPGVKRNRATTLLELYQKGDKDTCRFYRKEQELLGSRPTYDLEVDSASHLYVLANGLIVHNSGGVAGGGAKAISGFKTINQMLQSPSHWEGAIHAQEDGKVQSVKPDELGNTIVVVNGREHVVPHTHKTSVKPGDVIEAGDTISDGLPNPAEIVRHQGIGQGRVTYVQALRQAMKDGGVNTSRRNLELIAKGLIDHIHIDQEHGDYLTGDIVPYSRYESEYEPREGAAKGRPDFLKDQYLEEPVLHYTIGTKIRPSVLANLKKFGIKEVVAHKEPPRFQSQFVRAMANASVSPDWLTRMGGSYQKRSILEAAQKGMTADPFGPSYIPAVVARTDFTKRQPGQPDPVIKSVLPYLPPKEIKRLERELDPDVASWLDYDGDEPPVPVQPMQGSENFPAPEQESLFSGR